MTEKAIKNINKLNKFSHPRHQFIPFLILLVILAYLISEPLLTFTSLEQIPKINDLTEEQISESKKIKTGFQIINYSKFDVLNDEFKIDATIWFEYNPKEISLDLIERFTFDNAIIDEKNKIEQTKVNDLEYVKYHVKVSFKGNLNYKLFPLDDHELYLILANKFLDPDKNILVSDKNDFHVPDHIIDWDVKNYKVIPGYKNIVNDIEHRSTTYPVIEYSIGISRSSLRELVLIFLPLILIIFLIAVTFAKFLTERYEKSIEIAIGIVMALISYRFTTEPISPKVSYFMLNDVIFLFLISFTILTFYLTSFSSEFLERYRGIVLIIYYLFLILGIFYIFAFIH